MWLARTNQTLTTNARINPARLAADQSIHCQVIFQVAFQHIDPIFYLTSSSMVRGGPYPLDDAGAALETRW